MESYFILITHKKLIYKSLMLLELMRMIKTVSYMSVLKNSFYKMYLKMNQQEYISEVKTMNLCSLVSLFFIKLQTEVVKMFLFLIFDAH